MKAFPDIEKRRPVWSALSELFLDTSFDGDDLNRIARELAASPYSPEELDAILVSEVYPACHMNLFSVAGEWAGFNAEWLEKRIVAGPTVFSRFWANSIGKFVLSRSSEWGAIRSRVIDVRKKGAA